MKPPNQHLRLGHLLGILLSIFLATHASAQLRPQPSAEIEHRRDQEYRISWEGLPGRAYFIQTSTNVSEEEGFNWEFMPDVLLGTGNDLRITVETQDDEATFFRLIYADYSGSLDVGAEDFDNDGYTNLEEAMDNTDPFDPNSFSGDPRETPDQGGGEGPADGEDPPGDGGNAINLDEHEWAYRLTFSIGDQTLREQIVTPENPVRGESYNLDKVGDTDIKLEFENLKGESEVTFIRQEMNTDEGLGHDGPLWVYRGLVQLSKDNDTWSDGVEPGDSSGSEGVLQTVEITAAFGVGPNELPPDGPRQTSRQLLENYLGRIEVDRKGDVWVVNGRDLRGKDKIWGVEIVSNQAKLNKALTSSGRYVVFDGHSNFGLGPDFGENVARISDLTNYGVGHTDVPLNFRLRGPVNNPENWGEPFIQMEIANTEIPAAPRNYSPRPINEARFENIDGVGVGQAFQRQGQGFDTWHYRNLGGDERLMIDAPDSDLPANLAYKTFFYNACNTGIDYIENFQRGDFIYTKETCRVHQATQVFVQGVIGGRTTEQIMPLLNLPQIGGGPNVYAFERF